MQAIGGAAVAKSSLQSDNRDPNDGLHGHATDGATVMGKNGHAGFHWYYIRLLYTSLRPVSMFITHQLAGDDHPNLPAMADQSYLCFPLPLLPAGRGRFWIRWCKTAAADDGTLAMFWLWSSDHWYSISSRCTIIGSSALGHNLLPELPPNHLPFPAPTIAHVACGWWPDARLLSPVQFLYAFCFFPGATFKPFNICPSMVHTYFYMLDKTGHAVLPLKEGTTPPKFTHGQHFVIAKIGELQQLGAAHSPPRMEGLVFCDVEDFWQTLVPALSIDKAIMYKQTLLQFCWSSPSFFFLIVECLHLQLPACLAASNGLFPHCWLASFPHIMVTCTLLVKLLKQALFFPIVFLLCSRFFLWALASLCCSLMQPNQQPPSFFA